MFLKIPCQTRAAFSCSQTYVRSSLGGAWHFRIETSFQPTLRPLKALCSLLDLPWLNTYSMHLLQGTVEHFIVLGEEIFVPPRARVCRPPGRIRKFQFIKVENLNYTLSSMTSFASCLLGL